MLFLDLVFLQLFWGFYVFPESIPSSCVKKKKYMYPIGSSLICSVSKGYQFHSKSWDVLMTGERQFLFQWQDGKTNSFFLGTEGSTKINIPMRIVSEMGKPSWDTLSLKPYIFWLCSLSLFGKLLMYFI